MFSIMAHNLQGGWQIFEKMIAEVLAETAKFQNFVTLRKKTQVLEILDFFWKFWNITSKHHSLQGADKYQKIGLMTMQYQCDKSESGLLVFEWILVTKIQP